MLWFCCGHRCSFRCTLGMCWSTIGEMEWLRGENEWCQSLLMKKVWMCFGLYGESLQTPMLARYSPYNVYMYACYHKYNNPLQVFMTMHYFRDAWVTWFGNSHIFGQLGMSTLDLVKNSCLSVFLWTTAERMIQLIFELLTIRNCVFENRLCLGWSQPLWCTITTKLGCQSGHLFASLLTKVKTSESWRLIKSGRPSFDWLCICRLTFFCCVFFF